MAKDPAVLFYTSDFISGTITMTDEERGRYILLLCLQHQKGKLTEREMDTIKDMPEVKQKFERLEDGFYYNLKMKEESERRKRYSESRSKNRSNKNISKTYVKDMKNISKSYDKHMEAAAENKAIAKNKAKNKAEAISYSIVDKMFDKLLDVTTFKQGYTELLNEFGNIETALNIYTDDDSVKKNWTRQINQKLNVLP